MEVVNNKEEKVNDEKVKQPTMEELKNYCAQLLAQRNQLAQQLQGVSSVLNKLPWLFKIIENDTFFNIETVDKCVKEISDILFTDYSEDKVEPEAPTDEA